MINGQRDILKKRLHSRVNVERQTLSAGWCRIGSFSSILSRPFRASSFTVATETRAQSVELDVYQGCHSLGLEPNRTFKPLNQIGGRANPFIHSSFMLRLRASNTFVLLN